MDAELQNQDLQNTEIKKKIESQMELGCGWMSL